MWGATGGSAHSSARKGAGCSDARPGDVGRGHSSDMATEPVQNAALPAKNDGFNMFQHV